MDKRRAERILMRELDAREAGRRSPTSAETLKRAGHRWRDGETTEVVVLVSVCFDITRTCPRNGAGGERC
jgi:hypothetical protein